METTIKRVFTFTLSQDEAKTFRELLSFMEYREIEKAFPDKSVDFHSMLDGLVGELHNGIDKEDI